MSDGLEAAPTGATPAVSSRDTHLSRVARGSVINLAGAGFAAVGGFSLVVIITRLLDSRTSGEYFSATSAFLIVAGVALLGVDAGLSRFVLRFSALGRGSDVPIVLRTAGRSVVLLSIVGAVVCLVAAEPFARAIGLSPDDGPAAIRALGLFLPVAALSEVTLSGTRAFGTMHVTVLSDRLLRTALQAFAVLAVAWAGLGLTWVVVAWAAPYLVTATIGVMTLRSSVRRRDLGAPDPARAREVRAEFWSFTWPRSIAQVVQMVIQRIDIVLVAALVGAPQAAAYTAATRFVPLGQFIARAIQQALQPRLSEMLANDEHDEAEHVLRQSTAWGLLATWPFYLMAMALASTYLAVFGEGYVSDDARLVVLIMAAGMMVGAGVGALDTVLLMSGRSSLSLANSVVALVTDVGLCLILIPRWGIVGAAAAWAIAVAVRGLMGIWQVRRALSMSPFGAEWLWASGAIAGCLALPVGVAVAVGAPAVVVVVLGVVGTLAAAFVSRRPLQLGLLMRAMRGRKR